MEQSSLFASLSLTVSDLTHYLRQLLESDPVLQDVWVYGEISNLSKPSSGHIYFTLKDAGAALRCVIWRSSAARMRIDLQNGLAVEAHGAVSLYERDGAYQLYVTSVRPAGEGRLYQEFLRLKARLEEEGLFDTERKRPIPDRPNRIGIVTSPTGAALQDMLNTLQRRYPLCDVIIAPAAVQGVEAPMEIVSAIQALNALKPDVILVARGGGSLEDLWAFNDERVVRAIASSIVPVISGIGHETDFTLADFTADLRAPTPTAAAVMAVPDISEFKDKLTYLTDRLYDSLSTRTADEQDRLNLLRQQLKRNSPLWRIQNDRQRLDELSIAMHRGMQHGLKLHQAYLAGLSQRLRTVSPLAVLERGFAVVSTKDGSLLRSVKQAKPGDNLRIRLQDGTMNARVEDSNGEI